jgi:tyrosinase
LPKVLVFNADLRLDTSDFYHATIWSDSDYDGLGSWGDPDNDFRISTGGLKDMVVAYPVSHHLRRNYTLYPYFPPGFAFPAGVPYPDPSLMFNTTFTKAVVDATLNSTPGDYVNFQATIENISGPHPGPHLILGGDMGGTCPFGLGPPGCIPGQKWSPNGKLVCSLPFLLFDLHPLFLK